LGRHGPCRPTSYLHVLAQTSRYPLHTQVQTARGLAVEGHVKGARSPLALPLQGTSHTDLSAYGSPRSGSGAFFAGAGAGAGAGAVFTTGGGGRVTDLPPDTQYHRSDTSRPMTSKARRKLITQLNIFISAGFLRFHFALGIGVGLVFSRQEVDRPHLTHNMRICQCFMPRMLNSLPR